MCAWVVQEMADTEGLSYLAVLNAVWPFFSLTLEEFEHEIAAQTPESQRLWIAWIDGVPVGCAAGERSLWIPGSPNMEGSICVLPEHRRTGIGGELYRQLSSFAAERDFQGLRLIAFEDDPDGVGFLEHRGFVEVERSVYVQLDLGRRDIPSEPLPSGLTINSLAERPDLFPAFHDVLMEAVPDVPGDEKAGMMEYREWRRIVDTSPVFRPEAAWVVLRDGAALAVAELEFQGTRPDMAWHGFTAVRRAARGLGLAKALKTCTITYARQLGLQTLVTENEARNVAMRHINRRFGYEPIPAGIVFRGPLFST